MSGNSSSVPIALAMLTGMLAACVGALMFRPRPSALTTLHPEHPLFGR